MKIDFDCVRDILLTLENSISYKEDEGTYSVMFTSLNTICNNPSLSKFSKEDIIYASLKLYEAKFIDIIIKGQSENQTINQANISNIYYYGITYAGHQYLASISHSETWESIKEKFTEQPIEMTFNLVQKIAQRSIERRFGIELE